MIGVAGQDRNRLAQPNLGPYWREAGQGYHHPDSVSVVRQAPAAMVPAPPFSYNPASPNSAENSSMATASQPLGGTAKDDVSPCEGCRSRPLCAAGMACHRFQAWLHRGRRNDALSGVPTVAMFVRLFPECVALAGQKKPPTRGSGPGAVVGA